jgi:PAS domain S-box-containing protein
LLWQFSLYLLALLITTAVAAVVAIAAWRRRPKPGALPLALLMASVALWSLAYGLQVSSASVAAKYIWIKVAYLGVVTVPVAWLALVLQYTDRDARWLTRRNLIVLSAGAVVCLLLVWTNELHEWVWTDVTLKQRGGLRLWEAEHGWGFWLHVGYSYSLLLIGLLLLLVEALIRATRPYRAQALLLVLAALVPWVGNGLSSLGLVETAVNLTPFAFALSGVAIFLALFRHQLLDLSPVARDAAVESMNDAMVVLDAQDRIIDLNAAAARLLGLEGRALIGHKLSELLPQYGDLIGRYEPSPEAHDELCLELAGQERWYDMRLSTISDRRGRSRGCLIVLRDITERRELQESLEMQVRRVNQLLTVARATVEYPTLLSTLRNTLDIAVSLTQAEQGSIFLVDDRLKVSHSILASQELPPLARQALLDQVFDKGLAGWVLRERQTVIVDDASQDSRWLILPNQTYETGSALGVPICYGDQILGVLVLMHYQTAHFSLEHAETLEAAANQMALAIRNTQAYEVQRHLANQQAMLYETLRALQRPMPYEEATAETTLAISRLTEWPLVACLEVDESGAIQVRATTCTVSTMSVDLCLASEEIRAGLQSGQELYIPDALCDAGGLPLPSMWSVLSIPLKKEEQTQPILLIAVDRPMAFDDNARLLARSLGDVVTLILRNAALYQTILVERQRLDALVQSSQDGIILIGTDGRILVINQPMLDYVGLEQGAEAWTYRPVQDLLYAMQNQSPEMVKTFLAELRRVEEGDESAASGEIEIGEHILLWSNVPVWDGNRAVGRLVILHDVTEEHTVAQMREDLTHTMVHDLRNPLTGIHGALFLLNEQVGGMLSDRDAEHLGLAQRSADRMLDMVNAILDISRLESGRMPLDPTVFALSDLVAEVVTLFEKQAVQKRIWLIDALAEDLPPVWADRGLIERVLRNLVDNAVKFTPQGGRIRLTAEVSPEEPDRLYVSVGDTGPGIPPDIKERLFSKFVTGQQTEHGSGLSLAFCRMVLEAHHERIWVDSLPGEGATFTFTLPVAAEVMG